MTHKIKVSITYDESGMLTHWAVPVRVQAPAVKRPVDWVQVGLWVLVAVMFLVVCFGIAST